MKSSVDPCKSVSRKETATFPCPRATTVESALQIHPFTQNKPNSLKPQTTATSCATKSYTDIPPRRAQKNKPKQTQFPAPCCAGKKSRIPDRSAYPNLSGQHQRSGIQYRESSILPILPHIHALITQNKPNSLNPKTTATSFTPKIYANIPPHPTQKNKPNQTQSWRDTQYPIRDTKYKPNSPRSQLRRQPHLRIL